VLKKLLPNKPRHDTQPRARISLAVRHFKFLPVGVTMYRPYRIGLRTHSLHDVSK